MNLLDKAKERFNQYSMEVRISHLVMDAERYILKAASKGKTCTTVTFTGVDSLRLQAICEWAEGQNINASKTPDGSAITFSGWAEK